MFAQTLYPFMTVGWAGALLFGLPAIIALSGSGRLARLLGWGAILSGVAQIVVFASLSPGILFSMFLDLELIRGSVPFFWAPPTLLGLIAVVAGRWKLRRIGQRDRIRCTRCGYLLWGLVEPRCPECGSPFPKELLGALPDGTEPLTPAAVSCPSWCRVLASRRIRFLLGGLLIVAVIASAAYVILSRDIPFDRQAWLTGPKKHRARMANDIVESGMLIGLTHKEVVELLGTPDELVLAYKVGTDYNRLSIYLHLNDNTVGYGGFSLGEAPPSVQFDREIWRSASRVQRYAMAACLRREGFFEGKSRDEIIDALGMPDDDDSMRYSCRHANNALIVELRNGVVFNAFFFDF